MSVLSVRGLTIARGGATILKGVDWEIRRGEHWVVVGPNGSGKTSLLRALTGYLPPTKGHLSVLGETYGESDWRELRRVIGIVSASISQQIENPETAQEVVISGRFATINHWGPVHTADRREAKRVLRRVDAGHLADRPWLFLSQGERQRVLIGRALMTHPQLLILDEPCAGLDPVARTRFLRFVEDLMRTPDAPGVILVTHHVEEIRPTFTHALILGGGRVISTGPLVRSLTSPALSRAFGQPLRLTRSRTRKDWRLEVSEASGV